MLQPQKNDLFHIHTFRCRHAENVPDEEYVKKAVALGKAGIWFTDHAPFPGNPFGHRMGMEELPEYLDTLFSLKKKYDGICDVHIGLETEYFPSFEKSGYYRELLANNHLEFLLLGQHMAEDPTGGYTYDWKKERLNAEEWRALCDAIIAGIKSGYFAFVAHPDRSFRRCKSWNKEMEGKSRQIHSLSAEMQIPLEINMHSYGHKTQFWPQFWNLKTEDEQIIYGLDAHSIEEISTRLEKEKIFKEGVCD